MSEVSEADLRQRLVPLETYRGYVDGDAFVSCLLYTSDAADE